jgi:hypothetical protein
MKRLFRIVGDVQEHDDLSGLAKYGGSQISRFVLELEKRGS